MQAKFDSKKNPLSGRTERQGDQLYFISPLPINVGQSGALRLRDGKLELIFKGIEAQATTEGGKLLLRCPRNAPLDTLNSETPYRLTTDKTTYEVFVSEISNDFVVLGILMPWLKLGNAVELTEERVPASHTTLKRVGVNEEGTSWWFELEAATANEIATDAKQPSPLDLMADNIKTSKSGRLRAGDREYLVVDTRPAPKQMTGCQVVICDLLGLTTETYIKLGTVEASPLVNMGYELGKELWVKLLVNQPMPFGGQDSFTVSWEEHTFPNAQCSSLNDQTVIDFKLPSFSFEGPVTLTGGKGADKSWVVMDIKPLKEDHRYLAMVTLAPPESMEILDEELQVTDTDQADGDLRVITVHGETVNEEAVTPGTARRVAPPPLPPTAKESQAQLKRQTPAQKEGQPGAAPATSSSAPAKAGETRTGWTPRDPPIDNLVNCPMPDCGKGNYKDSELCVHCGAELPKLAMQDPLASRLDIAHRLDNLRDEAGDAKSDLRRRLDDDEEKEPATPTPSKGLTLGQMTVAIATIIAALLAFLWYNDTSAAPVTSLSNEQLASCIAHGNVKQDPGKATFSLIGSTRLATAEGKPLRIVPLKSGKQLICRGEATTGLTREGCVIR